MTITRVVRFAVLALAVIVMLNFWGLGLGGIWSGMLGLLAGIGVAMLATWAMVSNVTGAFSLALWHAYRLGDTFEILPEGTKGRAIDRNLMFTALRQDDGGIVSIPTTSSSSAGSPAIPRRPRATPRTCRRRRGATEPCRRIRSAFHFDTDCSICERSRNRDNRLRAGVPAIHGGKRQSPSRL